jgi:formate dehydrogenase (coenzyme F420) alpha subunit
MKNPPGAPTERSGRPALSGGAAVVPRGGEQVTGERIIKTLCRMCDDRCGIVVTVRDGRVVKVTGDPDHLWSRGHVCLKAAAAAELVHHPERLLKPLKRTGRGWKEIELGEALDEIAERLAAVRDQYGARSLGVWKGEALGFGQQEGIARRFAHAVGTPNYLCVDAVCWASRFIAYKLVLGGWPVPDFEHARCIVLWAADPPNSHPAMMPHIKAARRAGAPLVVVDPRRSTVARRADIHVPVRPGTDGALAWGLIRELIVSGACDRAAVEQRSVGLAAVAEYAGGFTPEVVEAETGVPAAMVREVAAVLAGAAPRVASYAGLGLEHHRNGVDSIRTLAILDVLLGAAGVEGGVRLPSPPPLRDLTLYDEVPLRHLRPLGADEFPVLYDICHDCHTPTALGAMLDGDPYPLRALVVTGANPVLAHPDSAWVARALESLDLLVVRDLFMTDTAALADYVLPAASFLERTELHAHHKYQLLTLTTPALSLPGVQDEYGFWRDLAVRLGAGAFFPWEDESALDRWLLEPTGATFEQLREHPEGVRYEAFPRGVAAGPRPFELTSSYLRDLGLDELPVYRRPARLQAPDPAYPLVLLAGGRSVQLLNSQFRGIPRLRDRAPGPELEMHGDDARGLGLATGDLVRVTSRTGSVDLPLRVVAAGDITPGAVRAVHGWSEANVNVLTSGDDPDPVSGFPPLRDVSVHVELAGHESPA